MKILAVSGSLRAASYNTALLHAARQLAPEEMEIQVFGLGDLPFFNQDVEDQGDPAPVAAWKDAVRAADGLLIACPEYNGGLTAVLKNAIDWASRGKPAPLDGKLACALGASPGLTGTVRAQDALRLNLKRAGCDLAPLSDILVGQAHTKFENGALTDERTRQAIARHLTSFAAALRTRG
ncbi:NADPH-dependent FMN reductase [Caulobacter sp. RL271]|jgi:chromate reductase|uniref:NAD(P)H-dependent oxidoreductase n=1 Tax=Caulobacter segnis TaxID=88688 RepID=A0ABY4ZYG2_9CAUL|nr:NADPH-dependent FMN reductase [Caulobacter segnis]USQ97816.1 NAD(P)H-dependent oxidoreductase [Caulobacter segnis]